MMMSAARECAELRWRALMRGVVVGCAVVVLGVGGCGGRGAGEHGGVVGRGIEPVEGGAEAGGGNGSSADSRGGQGDTDETRGGTADDDRAWVGATEGQRLVIHPLTRVGADAEGKSALLLHLEVLDRFGQSIKALGEVRVELLSSGRSAGRAWVVDLREARANAEMFDDLVTRTYVLPLGGVPEWVSAWAKGEGDEGPRLRVSFKAAEGGKELRAAERVKR